MLLKRVVLNNCFGFPKEYATSLDQFTVLVGPNNGGKTSVLRAIQFAMDAFRVYFGTGHEPNLSKPKENRDWVLNLNDATRRLGIQDIDHLYYGRSRNTSPAVTLSFEGTGGRAELAVGCPSGREQVQINLHINGEHYNRVHQKDPRLTASIIGLIHNIQCALVPPLGTISPAEKSKRLVNPVLSSRLRWSLSRSEEAPDVGAPCPAVPLPTRSRLA